MRSAPFGGDTHALLWVIGETYFTRLGAKQGGSRCLRFSVSVATMIAKYLAQYELNVRLFKTTLICIVAGLIVYVVTSAIDFVIRVANTSWARASVDSLQTASPVRASSYWSTVCRQNLLDKLAIDLREDLVHLG
jgi:hypothetical protein